MATEFEILTKACEKARREREIELLNLMLTVGAVKYKQEKPTKMWDALRVAEKADDVFKKTLANLVKAKQDAGLIC